MATAVSTFDLRDKLNALTAILREFESYIHRRGNEHCLVVDKLDFQNEWSDKEIIAECLTTMYYRKSGGSKMPAGVLLIDDEGMELANAVNAAKKDFAVLAQALNKPDSALPRGAKKALGNDKDTEHGRTDDLNDALRVGGNRQLWLQHCYRKLQIVPDLPRRISFTWNVNSSSRITLTREQALKKCSRSSDDLNQMTLGMWEKRILELDLTNRKLVEIKHKKNPQLKANVSGFSPISSPTIILVKADQMPKVTYRDFSEKSTHAQRPIKYDLTQYSLGFRNLYLLPAEDKDKKRPSKKKIK